MARIPCALYRPTPNLTTPPTPMPTYEYLCSSCQNAWEEMQKISEPPLEVCPKCQKPTARRQISGGNFILKGGGWYADLYSSTKPSGKKEEGGASTSSSDSKSDVKASPTKEGSTAPAAAAPATSSPASSGSGAAASGSKE